MEYAVIYMVFSLAFPLLGGIAAFFSGKRAPHLALSGMLVGFFFAIRMLAFAEPLVVRWEWLPGMRLGWHIDHLAALLIALVYLVSILVHLFSVRYLQGDAGLRRYFFKLGFFTSAMLGLLAADHFILLFVFWELVGFSSYLLIGYWFEDVARARSAREAFMINRVADAGLLIGVVLMVVLGHGYLSEPEQMEVSWLGHLAGFGLLIGALGKSAQFPFMGWLPKAMAGPTPVSALIHAATMVAAGVYLLIRSVPFLSPLVLDVAAVIGAVTALMAAYAALTQHDIKKVLAYSTISQLGYMIMGVGVGAYQASLFHLWTHAFFKAGLFLAAGSVIQYFHLLHPNAHFDAYDMRKMGGLKKYLPVTFIAFAVCGLALAGLPFFSGFLSKEGILSGAWIWARQASDSSFSLVYLVPDMAFLAAFLTPIYIGRQMLLVFFGPPRSEMRQVPAAEPAVLVKVPLVILALGSLWFFNALSPFDARGWWLNSYLFSLDFMEGSGGFESIEALTLVFSIALSVSGLFLSWYWYRPGWKVAAEYHSAGVPEGWLRRLSFHGWYVEGFYRMVSSGYVAMAKFARDIDRRVIDPIVNGFGVSVVVFSKICAILDREVVDGAVNFAAWLAKGVGILLSRVQSPSVQAQITWMVLALIALVMWLQF